MQMQELDDNVFLREYVKHDSEKAIATLVARHINKVYSVALRNIDYQWPPVPLSSLTNSFAPYTFSNAARIAAESTDVARP
jgi:hypothetical protein